MSYTNSTIFGPIPSRRFGISLGVDLSPSKKQCNFDCLYCELEGAKTTNEMDTFQTVEHIISEIKKSFQKHKKIDVITITANGEPTLYPYLDILIDEINKIKEDAKTLILSNGSTIYKKDIFDALLKFDTVKLSLDCVSDKCFKKLDRVHSDVNISKMIEYMAKFSIKSLNQFVLEVLFVKDLNDSEEEIKALYETIKKIEPSRVDIGTIDRPPAYKVSPVTFEKLENIANTFEGLNVNIVFKNRPKQLNSYSNDEIISLLKRRPLSEEDIENMFVNESKILLNSLLDDGVISIIKTSGVNFYKFVKTS